MNFEEIKSRMDELELKIQPMERELRSLKAKYRESKSLEDIKLLGITKSQIVTSWDKTRFGYIADFADFIRDEESKANWAEWNGLVYPTRDLLEGLMPDTTLLYSMVPED